MWTNHARIGLKILPSVILPPLKESAKIDRRPSRPRPARSIGPGATPLWGGRPRDPKRKRSTGQQEDRASIRITCVVFVGSGVSGLGLGAWQQYHPLAGHGGWGAGVDWSLTVRAGIGGSGGHRLGRRLRHRCPVRGSAGTGRCTPSPNPRLGFPLWVAGSGRAVGHRSVCRPTHECPPRQAERSEPAWG